MGSRMQANRKRGQNSNRTRTGRTPAVREDAAPSPAIYDFEAEEHLESREPLATEDWSVADEWAFPKRRAADRGETPARVRPESSPRARPDSPPRPRLESPPPSR